MFAESTGDYKIDWKKCIALCSDGAQAMTGKKQTRCEIKINDAKHIRDTLFSSSASSGSQGFTFLFKWRA